MHETKTIDNQNERKSRDLTILIFKGPPKIPKIPKVTLQQTQKRRSVVIRNDVHPNVLLLLKKRLYDSMEIENHSRLVVEKLITAPDPVTNGELYFLLVLCLEALFLEQISNNHALKLENFVLEFHDDDIFMKIVQNLDDNVNLVTKKNPNWEEPKTVMKNFQGIILQVKEVVIRKYSRNSMVSTFDEESDSLAESKIKDFPQNYANLEDVLDNLIGLTNGCEGSAMDIAKIKSILVTNMQKLGAIKPETPRLGNLEFWEYNPTKSLNYSQMNNQNVIYRLFTIGSHTFLKEKIENSEFERFESIRDEEMGIIHYIKKEYDQAFEILKNIKTGISDFLVGKMILDHKVIGVEKDACFQLFDKSAASGNCNGQFEVAMCYKNGIGVEIDLVKSASIFRLAAEQGHSQAQFHLFEIFQNGQGVDLDLQKAIEYAKMSSEQFNSDGEDALGFMYFHAIGVDRNQRHAVHLFERSAIQGNPLGRYHLAKCYYLGRGVKQNYLIACKHLQMSAEAGMPDAAADFAKCLLHGFGIVKNVKHAVYWLTKSAGQGSAYSQYQLGCLYYAGNGVTQDYELAVAFFKEAVAQNYTEAEEFLGECYYNGHGVDQCFKTAFSLFKTSAEKGNVTAMFKLARMYQQGDDVNVDLSLAFDWFLKSAKNGHMQSQHLVGMCYIEGQGVEKDVETGFTWLKYSADQNFPLACYQVGLCYEKGIGTKKNIPNATSYFETALKGGIFMADSHVKHLKLERSCIIS